MAVAAVLAGTAGGPAAAQLSVDEQHRIRWHAEKEILQYFVPPGPPPVTVATEDPAIPDRYLSLDEAIQLALRHSEVVRVLTGASAAASGSTVYDTAIATTAIDQQVGRFDPVFFANSTYRHTETPIAVPTPAMPLRAMISDAQADTNGAALGLTKTNRLGGTGEFVFFHDWTRNRLDGVPAFNPSQRPTMEVSYTQPLLAGGGFAVNEAPILIARLDLDRSYFQYKRSIQQLVQGVIKGYWALVSSRTNLWAREQQVDQLRQVYELELKREQVGRSALPEVSQRRVALANFRANLITAQADVLQREAALRNLMGLPPEDSVRLVPSTPPTRDGVQFDWRELFDTAQGRRPDLIELNLILQADLQSLMQTKNFAKPTLDATAVHRWNGLRGKIFDDSSISSEPSNHTGWTLGVTFSVPLGLRAARAQVRSTELLIARDRANIHQGLHATKHTIATNVRNLDVAFQQYRAFQETREAARENLTAQFAGERFGRINFLNALQAVTDWGNAVSSEADTLTGYNTELANLEFDTGTILETHKVFFVEERYATIGPCGKLHAPDRYPRDLRSLRSTMRYSDTGEAAEKSFDLEDFDVMQERLLNSPLMNDDVDTGPPEEIPAPLFDQGAPPVNQDTPTARPYDSHLFRNLVPERLSRLFR